MHLNLTTPWQAGTIDDMATYPHAKIVGFSIDVARVQQVIITVEFGTWVDDDVDEEQNPMPPYWRSGVTGRYRIRLGESEFAAFLQNNGQVLQALQAALYETVQAKYPQKAAGTLV